MRKIIVALILSLCFVSCSSDSCTNEKIIKSLHTQTSIKMYDSIDDCIDTADYIVTCTVSEIGEPFLYGNPKIDSDSKTEEINDYIRSIRTPLTLDILDVHYASKEINDDTLTVLLFKGVYNGYELTNDFPEYKIGHTYLLFIREAPDGTTNIINHQGSAEINVADSKELSSRSTSETQFYPLFNTKVFEDYSCISDIFSEEVVDR